MGVVFCQVLLGFWCQDLLGFCCQGLLVFWSGYYGRVDFLVTSHGNRSMLAMGIFPVKPQLSRCLCKG